MPPLTTLLPFLVPSLILALIVAWLDRRIARRDRQLVSTLLAVIRDERDRGMDGVAQGAAVRAADAIVAAVTRLAPWEEGVRLVLREEALANGARARAAERALRDLATLLEEVHALRRVLGAPDNPEGPGTLLHLPLAPAEPPVEERPTDPDEPPAEARAPLTSGILPPAPGLAPDEDETTMDEDADEPTLIGLRPRVAQPLPPHVPGAAS
jgi:hypothetical protein